MSLDEVLSRIKYDSLLSESEKVFFQNTYYGAYQMSTTFSDTMDKLVKNDEYLYIDNTDFPSAHIFFNKIHFNIEEFELHDIRSINQNGHVFKLSKERALIHETIHAIDNLTDPDGDFFDDTFPDYSDFFDKTGDYDYKGDTVRKTDQVMSELGSVNERVTYFSWDSVFNSFSPSRNTSFSNGNPIDVAIFDALNKSGDSDFDTSGLNGATRDVLISLDENRKMIAGDGTDYLWGNGGDDTLDGGADDDYLVGGSGDDILIGGSGYDTYIFENDSVGHDIITDSDNMGSLTLDGLTYGGGATFLSDGNWELGDYNLTQSGDDIVFTKETEGGAENSITVTDMAKNGGALGIELGDALYNFILDVTLSTPLLGTDSFTLDYTFNENAIPLYSSENGGGYLSSSATFTSSTSHTPLRNPLYIYVRNIDEADENPNYSDGYGFYGAFDSASLFGYNFYDISMNFRDYSKAMLSDNSLPNDVSIFSELNSSSATMYMFTYYPDNVPGADDTGELGFDDFSFTFTQGLTVGASATANITGSDADNVMNGGNSSDYLYAKGGDDTIVGGSGAGNDDYDGGDNEDTITYTSTSQGIILSLKNGKATGIEIDTDRLSNIEHVVGGLGDDFIQGDAKDNKLDGRAGNDKTYGCEGDDTLIGYEGHDYLKGSTGDDSLEGGIGNDSLRGNEGNDTLNGGDDNDVLRGGAGLNIFNGGSGDDKIIGGIDADVMDGDDGNDRFYGFGGDDTLNGGNGKDYLNAGDGNDTLNGGTGDDVLRGESGLNVLFGDHGDDTLIGGADADVLNGGDNEDRLYGFGGNDTVNGGRGHDVLRVESGDNLLNGGQGDDTLVGGSGADTMEGGDSGNDRFYAKGGNDSILGGNGKDYVKAGAGNDFMHGGTGDDTLIGGIGNDTLNGGADEDRLTGGEGADIFVFSSYSDSIHSNGLFDRITDFEIGIDTIDTSAMSFTGLTFTNHVENGELRVHYSELSDRTYISDGHSRG